MKSEYAPTAPKTLLVKTPIKAKFICAIDE